MEFKEQLLNDLGTFFNTTEFGEDHIINKRKLSIIIDNDVLKKRTKKEYEGIYVGDLLYFVKANDYGNPPKVDDIQILDGKPYIVFDVNIQNGIYEVILKFNRS